MSDPRYLLPEDDGLIVREFQKGTIDKVEYVSNYIEVFETAMRKKFKTRCYVELFSGPGKCKVRNTSEFFLGTPLRALTVQYPFTHYIFNDYQQENVDALKQRVAAVSHLANIQLLNEDANQVVAKIVNTIPKWSLNLALLDQDDLDLKWTTVQTLTQIDRIDLIIHYPQMGIARYIPHAYEKDSYPNKLDEFFGDQGWRNIYESHRKKGSRKFHRDLMDYYKGRLQDFGYVHVQRDDETGIEPLVKNAQTNSPLYRLIFASKHKKGEDFWRAVTRKEPSGQKRLF
jgi:three-Cys-motif partner protein